MTSYTCSGIYIFKISSKNVLNKKRYFDKNNSKNIIIFFLKVFGMHRTIIGGNFAPIGEFKALLKIGEN
jgi:hypothetical protein